MLTVNAETSPGESWVLCGGWASGSLSSSFSGFSGDSPSLVGGETESWRLGGMDDDGEVLDVVDSS